MFGCRSRAAIAISRRKRSRPNDAAMSGRITLTATLRACLSIARQVHTRHPATTNFALDPVAPAQRLRELDLAFLVEQVRRTARPPGD